MIGVSPSFNHEEGEPAALRRAKKKKTIPTTRIMDRGQGSHAQLPLALLALALSPETALAHTACRRRQHGLSARAVGPWRRNLVVLFHTRKLG